MIIFIIIIITTIDRSTGTGNTESVGVIVTGADDEIILKAFILKEEDSNEKENFIKILSTSVCNFVCIAKPVGWLHGVLMMMMIMVVVGDDNDNIDDDSDGDGDDDDDYDNGNCSGEGRYGYT